MIIEGGLTATGNAPGVIRSRVDLIVVIASSNATSSGNTAGLVDLAVAPINACRAVQVTATACVLADVGVVVWGIFAAL